MFKLVPLLLILPLLCFSIQFELTGFDEKQFTDDFPADTYIVGSIGAPLEFDREVPITQVDFRIEDPRGMVVYEKVDVKGVSKWAFTTSLPGEFRFIVSCRITVNSMHLGPRTIIFDYKLGQTAESLSELAKSEQLKPVELEMRRVQEYLRTVHTTQLYLRDLGQETSVANESTNARIPYFTLLIITIIIATSVVQAFILKKDLKRLKIA
ncbi:hypothetical protein P9112_012513 [Eukaryota sp. TZLM1-RC]